MSLSADLSAWAALFLFLAYFIIIGCYFAVLVFVLVLGILGIGFAYIPGCFAGVIEQATMVLQGVFTGS